MIAEMGVSGLKGKQLFPHELLQQVLNPKRGGELSDAVCAILNSQWEAVRNGLLEMVEARKAEHPITSPIKIKKRGVNSGGANGNPGASLPLLSFSLRIPLLLSSVFSLTHLLMSLVCALSSSVFLKPKWETSPFPNSLIVSDSRRFLTLFSEFSSEYYPMQTEQTTSDVSALSLYEHSCFLCKS
jgi:hypothetical protein